jgi:hypothetical protein
MKCLYQARKVNSHVCGTMYQIFLCFYDYFIGFWNCSDRVVFFVFHFMTNLIKYTNWPPRYNWNIVESGIKYHKPTNQICVLLDIQCIYFILLYNICLTARILVSKSEWLGILDQICHKMKNKKYHSVGTIPKSNKIIIKFKIWVFFITTLLTQLRVDIHMWKTLASFF